MRVQSSQLIPGCILINDVIGKTNKPIIPANTVLTEKHIKVLKDFLIEEVDVLHHLADGTPFEPESNENTASEEWSTMPFDHHYLHVVEHYKLMFETWRNNEPVNVRAALDLIIPLLRRVEELGSDVYKLYRLATKNDYFYHHCVAVSILSTFLARKMGYPKEEWYKVGLAGLLSDAGMAKLGDFAMIKEGILTEEEKNEIKKHPVYSYRMVEDIPGIPYDVKLGILQHHERIDGSGYPLGLPKDKIHRFAKIIAVCDIYHAMTSERLYRKKQSSFQVIEELEKEQFRKLDPRVVQIFVDAITNFSIGSAITLSNDKIGEIVFIDQKQPTRPIIRLENGEIISLRNHPQLHIKEIN